MSFRVQSGRSFPDNINMSGIKSVSPELKSAMEALMVAKLSHAQPSEVVGVWTALTSNASVETRIAGLEQKLGSFIDLMLNKAEEAKTAGEEK